MNDFLDTDDEALLAEFRGLWAEADALWERHSEEPEFRGYVSADYLAVFDSLAGLRRQAVTFLEWGSGLGVVTIMASRMGFEAYGMEAEPRLVEMSERFAERFGEQATFATGSFVPDAFEWNPANGDEQVITVDNGGDAYDELDMELRDFDLVYAYPWPDEQPMFQNIMRDCGGPNSLLLIYDAREGIALHRFES